MTLVASAMVVLPQLAGAIDFVAIVPDGRILEREITSADRVGFFFSVQAGRSYTVTVVTDDNFSGLTAGFTDSPSGTCADTDDPFVVRHETTEPRIAFGAGRGVRASFIAPATQAFVACVTSNSVTAHTIYGSASETTLFNPLWSTSGAFETFYKFQNTTNATCNVTLRLKDTGGTERVNTTFAIEADSGSATRNTGAGDFNVPDNLSGVATIAHDCPPGGIQASVFAGVFTSSTTAVLPLNVVPAREAAH